MADAASSDFPRTSACTARCTARWSNTKPPSKARYALWREADGSSIELLADDSTAALDHRDLPRDLNISHVLGAGLGASY